MGRNRFYLKMLGFAILPREYKFGGASNIDWLSTALERDVRGGGLLMKPARKNEIELN